MKKSYLVLSAVFAIATTAILFNSQPTDQAYTPRTVDNSVAQEAQGAMDHYNLLRADPITGVINQEIASKVQAAVNKLPSNASRNNEYNWISHGPDNIGGRTRAFHVYKGDPSQMLAGSVGGGLYKSNNGGASWNRLEGFNDNSAISSVTRLGNGTIYVGTGNTPEGSAGGNSGGNNNSQTLGHGLFKSTDGGDTFTNVYAPDGVDFGFGAWSRVDEVVASPVDDNVVFIAYGGGFAKLNDSNGNLEDLIGTAVTDFDISNDGEGIICVNGGTIKISLNGGDSFETVNNNEDQGGIPGSGGRKIVAISPDDKNYMYVTTTAGGSLRGVFATINGGENFDRIAQAVTITNGVPSNPFFFPFGANAQGWYDNALTVVPGHPGSVILGGITMYRLNISPNSTPTSINGTWNQINNQFGFPGPDYVHADIHNFFWDENGIFYIGTDGGMFRSENDQANSFYSINYNYRTSQFYGIGFNRQGNIFGGMQDNGTMIIVGSDLNGNTNFESIDINGGDGFDVEVSNYEELAFVASQYNSIQVLSYNFNGGGSSSPMPLKEGTSGAGDAPFYTCMKYYENFNETNAPNSVEFIFQDDINEGEEFNYQSASFSHTFTTTAAEDYLEGDTVYLQDRVQTLFAYADQGQFHMTRNAVNNQLNPELDWATFSVSGTPLCFEFSQDGNHLYIGTTQGRIYRIGNLRSAYTKNELQALNIEQIYSGGTVITDLALDAGNANKLVASRGSYANINHVIYTDNATGAEGNDDFEEIWNVDGFLSNMPVYSITFDNNASSSRVLAGTEYGIFVTDNLGETEWEECNSGDMFRVPVYDLRQQVRNDDDVTNYNVIYAGTHGGGVFSAGNYNVTGIADSPIIAPKSKLSIYPNPANDYVNLDFDLKGSSVVIVDIFNMNGNHVKTINTGKLAQGAASLTLDVTDFANGTYITTVLVDGKKAHSGKFNVIR